MSNVRDLFGFSSDDVEEAFKEKEEEEARKRDGRICSCGHPVKHHTKTSDGYISCKPGRQFCPCEMLAPVIKVPDTRYFMRRSQGNGARHALSMGIHAAIKANTKSEDLMEWLVPPVCQNPNCGNEGVKLYPTHITAERVVMDEPTKFNVLLCDDCRFG